EVERGVDASDHVRQELGLALAPARFFVEARVLDRDGRLVGQEPREVLFLGGEAGPTAEPDDQRADRAIVMDERQPDARMQIAGLGCRAGAPAWIDLHVAEILRPARGEHGAGDAVVAWHGHGPPALVRALGLRPVASALAQRVGAVVYPDVRHLSLQQNGG